MKSSNGQQHLISQHGLLVVLRAQFVWAFPVSTAAQYAMSTAAFVLISVPQGVSVVVVTGLIGLLRMALYRTTRALAGPIVVHYFVNLIRFSGVMEGGSLITEWLGMTP